MDPLTSARVGPDRTPHDIVASVRAFCRARVDSARIDREARIDGDLLAAIGEQGFFGLTVPEEYGGIGLSLAAVAPVIAELAAHDGSVSTCVGLHSGLAMHALLHEASPALRARYLPSVAAGRRILAFAATEPGAGSDIASVRTRLRAEGDGLVLRGSKCFVTNGGIAGLVTVLAASPGIGGARAGHTLVLIDPRWPGVHRGVEERKLGLKGSSTITIDFDDVVVPKDHVLGAPSKGLHHAHRALEWGRTLMAAGCLGAARASLAAATAHVTTRVQFGRPLIAFPLVAESIAEMRAEIAAIESTLALVTAQDELAIPSAIVKVLASEGAFRVVDRALQLFGGAGFIEDTGIARRLRDVRVTRIFEGANDVLRLHIASDALRWPLDPLRESFPELVGVLDGVRREHGFRLFREQGLQVELADAIIARYAALASAGKRDVDRLARALQLERAEAALLRARAPRDPGRRALIERVSACST